MDWYDRAEDYDRLFSWDPADERDFILGASERWGLARPRRILEPFCGPGRLLRAMPGKAIGFDLNRNMVRLAARTCTVFRADAAAFALRPASFDLAFCLVDSFRYLLTEADASSHLRCVARALRPGAVYVLGFELEGDLSQETIEANGMRVTVGMLGDAERRIETFRARVESEEGSYESLAPMRTYSAGQFEDLVEDEGSFEIAATFDRSYDLEQPVEITEVKGSVVLALRRCA